MEKTNDVRGKQPQVLTHPTPTIVHPPPHLLSLFTVYLITCPTRPGLLARSDAKWLQAKSLEKHQCHFNNGRRNIPLGFSEFMLRTLPIYPAALWELNYCLFQIIIQNVDTQINANICLCLQCFIDSSHKLGLDYDSNHN